MSAEKKASAKNDIFAFYIGRKLSYLLTIPFLYTKLSPNAISLLSMVPIAAGFILCVFGKTPQASLAAWACFFLWNLLDGVDGNVARYKKQFSKMGSVYDAMSGYAAMVLSFFAWGILAAHRPGVLQRAVAFPQEAYIILGALSGIFVIFPRLVMHKAITALGDKNAMDAVKDKAHYDAVKMIALNLTSIAGFVQVFMLFSVILNMEDLFTAGYFFVNLAVMLVSLRTVLTGER